MWRSISFLPKVLLICLIAVFATGMSQKATAQRAGDVVMMFNAMMRAAVLNQVRVEWSKVSPTEILCIEQGLQPQGYSIDVLIRNGIAPTDARISSLRMACRVSITSLSPSNIPTQQQMPIPQRLSDKPTFNCEKARSPTARLICFDPDGAKADWNLASVYWARQFSLPKSQQESFQKAHDKWFPQLSAACQLRSDQFQFTADQRRCVIAAYNKRANMYRSQLSGDALTESRLTPEQHAQVQTRLIELGYLTDEADGEFGPKTRAAIRRFNQEAGIPENEFLTAERGQQLLQNEPWPRTAEVAPKNRETVGSVASPSPVQAPTAKETAKLKGARIFLEDSQKFISAQQTVPSISAIASEAANLQIALDKFDESAAVQSMNKLGDLLKPIAGFSDFQKQQQAERDRQDARQLAELKLKVDENLNFIDGYVKAHLGDLKTTSLIKLREQTTSAVKKNSIDGLTTANDAVQGYVKENGLADAYEAFASTNGNKTGTTGESPKSLAERLGLTDKSTFLVEGPKDELMLFFNASSTAPNVWTNVRGDLVFQDDAASLCFGHVKPRAALVRYIERTMRDRGAKRFISEIRHCDFNKAATSIDIIVIERGELLKERDSEILSLSKLIEEGTFKKLEVISDYASLHQSLETLSLQIESDVEKNSRQGYGVLAVNDSSAACVITMRSAEQLDGLKELLKRNRDLIAPNLTAEWQFVETTADLAFRGLQRKQCGYAVGNADVLHSLMQALQREKFAYRFSPVWFETSDVAQASFDVRDATEQDIRKKEADKQAQKEREALEELRNRNKENSKAELERQLRLKYGNRVRGLTNETHKFIKALAEQREQDKSRFFATYSDWLDRRFVDQWETFDVRSDAADFGTVQWNGRTVDAIIIKSVVQQKNRMLGKYDSRCFMFGFIDDVEFRMQRDSIVVDCDGGGRTLTNWKIGKHFQSQWNAM